MLGVNGDKCLFVSVCFSLGKSMSKWFTLLAKGKCQWGIEGAALGSTGPAKAFYMSWPTSLRACHVCFFGACSWICVLRYSPIKCVLARLSVFMLICLPMYALQFH